jgi:hypothetical protein
MRWEYATLELDYVPDQILLQVGRKSPEKVGERTDLSSVLAKLEKQGWQLAGTLPGTLDSENWTMIFKRPLSRSS